MHPVHHSRVNLTLWPISAKKGVKTRNVFGAPHITTTHLGFNTPIALTYYLSHGKPHGLPLSTNHNITITSHNKGIYVIMMEVNASKQVGIYKCEHGARQSW